MTVTLIRLVVVNTETTNQSIENNWLWNAQPQMEHLYQALPLKDQETLEKPEALKETEIREDSREMVSSRHRRASILMSSQQLGLPTQDLNKFKTVNMPV